MLDELVVRNLGVIEEARIQPSPGLTVITGETGAGKTLLLGALRLLIGESARPDLVGPFGDEAVAEARFVAAGGAELGLGRRLTRGGRSRAYLDGAIASAASLDEAGAGLVEIVGQHDQLAITRPGETRALVDRLLDPPGVAEAAGYRETWGHCQALRADQAILGGDRRHLERELDLTRHQAAEIARAGFETGDDIALDARLLRLRNAEALRANLEVSRLGIDQARDGLGSAVAEIRKAAALDPSLEELKAEFESIEGRLGDVAILARTLGDDLVIDPGELESAEDRLHLLGDLRRKYGSNLDEILAYGRDAGRRAQELSGLAEGVDRIGAELETAELELARAGERLIQARRLAADRLVETAMAHLVELGFTDPLLLVEVSGSDATAHGADQIRLLFASDRRLAPGEIGRVASGGELSRLVLSLRLAGSVGDAETLIFDEIDAGVGGVTALALGRKLAALADNRQVVCVTHLPQVAAFADLHYVVTREGVSARVDPVEGAARRQELSRMLAGLPGSERGQQAADELLALARAAGSTKA